MAADLCGTQWPAYRELEEPGSRWVRDGLLRIRCPGGFAGIRIKFWKLIVRRFLLRTILRWFVFRRKLIGEVKFRGLIFRGLVLRERKFVQFHDGGKLIREQYDESGRPVGHTSEQQRRKSRRDGRHVHAAGHR